MSYEIKEGTEGQWHYHLAEEGDTESLCGEPVMPCGTELWGEKGENALSSYCHECEQIAGTFRAYMPNEEEEEGFFTSLLKRLGLSE